MRVAECNNVFMYLWGWLYSKTDFRVPSLGENSSTSHSLLNTPTPHTWKNLPSSQSLTLRKIPKGAWQPVRSNQSTMRCQQMLTTSKLSRKSKVRVFTRGNFFFCDSLNSSVRKLNEDSLLLYAISHVFEILYLASF